MLVSAVFAVSLAIASAFPTERVQGQVPGTLVLIAIE